MVKSQADQSASYPADVNQLTLRWRGASKPNVPRHSVVSGYQLPAWINTGDPLLSEHTYMLYHHSATIFWPGFDRGSDKSHTPPFTLSWALLREQGPALFHSMMWQAAMHLSVIHKRPITERESIAHHHSAISCLLTELNRPPESVDESTLWGMLGIATTESGGVVDMLDMAAGFRPLGAELQWLDFYGRRALVKSHVKALYQIIDSKGGLDALKMPGFFGSIQITDLFQSTHCLSTPHFPLAKPFEAMKNIMQASFTILLTQFEQTAVGIAAQNIMVKLVEHGLSSQLCNVILDYRAFCLSTTNGLDDAGQDLSFLAVQRNLIHYGLLCTIPLVEDIDTWSPAAIPVDGDDQEQVDLDGLMRTGLLIFSIGVVFPLSNLAVWQALVARLQVQVSQALKELLKPDLRTLLLWLCMMGGLASARISDLTSQAWFIDIICTVELEELLSLAPNIPQARPSEARPWNRVKTLLKTVVWSDISCDQGARLIWSEVLDRVSCSIQVIQHGAILSKLTETNLSIAQVASAMATDDAVHVEAHHRESSSFV